jgi:isocitrate dehydrogenase kinase/phosphatase
LRADGLPPRFDSDSHMATVLRPSLDEHHPDALAQSAADAIRQGYASFHEEFNRISRLAQARFERRDWRGIQQDALERLELRTRILSDVIAQLREHLGDLVSDRSLWASMKAAYTALIAGGADWQLAETFFNSVSRRVFATVGVDPNIEFVSSDVAMMPIVAAEPIYRTYHPQGSTSELIERILKEVSFSGPWRDLSSDALLAGGKIDQYLRYSGNGQGMDAVEVLRPIFYRGKGAYLVGRLRRRDILTPFILALLNHEEGIELDAVLLEPSDASNVFSFTRSYFHVEMNQPVELVEFLKSILPLKRVSEIYIALGRHKHGKTELYREVLQHLEQTQDCFVPARGDKGLVMVVFTLPGLDVVFKVIRDKFPLPKTNTKPEVKSKYALVFLHDRAGRLVDAQEFEHLAFERSRFAPQLLEELASTCGESVTVTGDQVHIRHLYAERRLVPLNLFVREMNEANARAAIIDYGQSIRDLAATNTFPGDLLLKNFGVTRSGRVIFYDYDELCLITECNFRDMPRPRSDEEEMSGEPWFYVGERDVFPEEFLPFLGLSEPLERAFVSAHSELLTPEFWRRMQELHQAGEIIHIFPYRQEKRLRPVIRLPRE